MSNKPYKYLVVVCVIIVTLLIGGTQEVCAQCQTCKANVETNLATGGTIGLGINSGIFYLLAMPYLMVMGLGILWYYSRKKKKRASLES